ncbi:FKBP-type peptidyl-prolyl cis-trans isomerase [Flaviaesturariibacter amylovorans]|uniref:Peptidyl-prolyl cis-trans isomerase n=1 Tax=Flaviaesturariibacter amylovorans TaxID=1084520 RepID=A0ABP8HIP9_9BACT
MKKLFLVSALAVSLASSAQKKPVAKPAAKSPATPGLKNMTDSASYAIGISVANFYKQQGMKSLNPTLVARAIQDALGGKTTLLSEHQAQTVLMNYMNRAQASKAQPNIDAGERFLAQNRKKPGVKVTASGLQYEVIKEGEGPKPAATDTVVAHYAGTLIDGKKFDNSYDRNEPITIPLNGVIRGWTEGLQLMSAGSKYRFFIPYQLGYGTNDAGSIPAGSALIFEVELLEVKGKKQ